MTVAMFAFGPYGWELCAFLAGAVVSGVFIGAVGVGGNALAPLLLLCNVPLDHAGAAVTASMLPASATAVASRWQRLPKRRAIVLCAASIPGACLGELLWPVVPALWISTFIAVLSTVCGVHIIIRLSHSPSRSHGLGSTESALAKVALPLIPSKSSTVAATSAMVGAPQPASNSMHWVDDIETDSVAMASSAKVGAVASKGTADISPSSTMDMLPHTDGGRVLDDEILVDEAGTSSTMLDGDASIAPGKDTVKPTAVEDLEAASGGGDNPPDDTRGSRRDIVIGALGGFLSVMTATGGAFVTIPLLMLVNPSISPAHAVSLGQAITVPITVCTALVAALSPSATLDVALAAMIGCAVTLGVPAGVRLAKHSNPAHLRLAIALCLLAGGATALEKTVLHAYEQLGYASTVAL